MEMKKAGPENRKRFYLRLSFLAVALVLAFFGGREFYELRHYKETVVSAPGLTEVKMLSDYLKNLKGTWMDTPIFVYDSGVPGGSVLYMANVHPYEPATSLSAYILMENIKVSKGKVFVIPQGNRSGSTTGMLGNAYPKFFRVPTTFGEKKLRIGDRGTNPLDQWPDPFTYVNYPSKQSLAYQDIRNMNRTYPGRKDGTLTERASFAIMELIRKEKIDLSIDAHEASLMYPVVSTYVAHERSFDLAMMAAMTLTAGTFDMKCESSPK
ncbi:MAG TPA: succinylglutamate desuccinylase, partial [Rectinemataceae bacterium]|nr:succinylglutamate desuccinylase [Rectinemataceae bacterium]